MYCKKCHILIELAREFRLPVSAIKRLCRLLNPPCEEQHPAGKKLKLSRQS